MGIWILGKSILGWINSRKSVYYELKEILSCVKAAF